MSRDYPHSRNISGLSYSLQSSDATRFALMNFVVFQTSLQILLSPVILYADWQPFSGLFRDVCSGGSSGWNAQGHSGLSPSRIVVLYLCYTWTFSKVRGPWHSGSGFYQMHRYELTRLTIQGTWKHPRCLLLSSILGWSWALPGLLQTWCLESKPKKSSLG